MIYTCNQVLIMDHEIMASGWVGIGKGCSPYYRSSTASTAFLPTASGTHVLGSFWSANQFHSSHTYQQMRHNNAASQMNRWWLWRGDVKLKVVCCLRRTDVEVLFSVRLMALAIISAANFLPLLGKKIHTFPNQVDDQSFLGCYFFTSIFPSIYPVS